MKMESFNKDLNYNENRVAIKVILETSFSKEIRILMKKGQVMNEHKAPFPIIVHLLEGSIHFGVDGVIHQLNKGDVLTLEGNVPHNLLAKSDSVVRLSLSKLDKSERVQQVANRA